MQQNCLWDKLIPGSTHTRKLIPPDTTFKGAYKIEGSYSMVQPARPIGRLKLKLMRRELKTVVKGKPLRSVLLSDLKL